MKTRAGPADLEHGELVFRDGVEIWKDPKGTGQPVPRARRARRELGTGYVVNAGGGDELGRDREIALVEDVLDQAARIFRSSGDMWLSLRPDAPG